MFAMKAVTLALVAAAPAALAQCSYDHCSDAVNSLLSGGEALAEYASDLCSSAIAATTTVSASQSTPTTSRYGGYFKPKFHDDKRDPSDLFTPSWAYGCKDRADFASACRCASIVPGTSTVYISYSPPTSSSAHPSSTPVSPIVTSTKSASSSPPYKPTSSLPIPHGNASTTSVHPSGTLSKSSSSSSSSISIPSGYSSGVPLSSAVAASIAFVPAAAIAAGPSGPTSLASPSSSSSSSSSVSVPSGFSSGVPLSSAEAASIAFVPDASVKETPTGPTTLLTKVSSTSSVSVPSGFSSGVPLKSATAEAIAFVPAESVTATPSGPTSLAPGVSPAVTTNSLLPGATATAQKARRHGFFGRRAPGRHTPCPPRQVGIFFDLLTSFASPACGEEDS